MTESKNFIISMIIITGMFSLVMTVMWLLVDDYYEKVGFIHDAVEIKEETVNGTYCVIYVIKEKYETFNGKELIIEENFPEKKKCISSSDGYAIKLHEEVKERQAELRIIENDPILKKLEAHKSKWDIKPNLHQLEKSHWT